MGVPSSIVSIDAVAISVGASVIVGVGRPPPPRPAAESGRCRDSTEPFAAVAADADPELEPHAGRPAMAPTVMRRRAIERSLLVDTLFSVLGSADSRRGTAGWVGDRAPEGTRQLSRSQIQIVGRSCLT